MKVTLSSNKKKELEEMHNSTSDGRGLDRIKAVLLISEGRSYAMISQTLLIHEIAVIRHINDYLQSEKLKPYNDCGQSGLSTVQTTANIERLAEFTFCHIRKIVAYVEAESDYYSVRIWING